MKGQISIVLVMLKTATKNMDILIKKTCVVVQAPQNAEDSKSMGLRWLNNDVITGMVKRVVKISNDVITM